MNKPTKKRIDQRRKTHLAKIKVIVTLKILILMIKLVPFQILLTLF